MQILINILVTTSQILLIATGFSMIFYTTRFFHFAHGIIFTAGAYLSLLLFTWLNIHLAVSIILGIILCSVVGCLMEISVYRPLRNKKSSELILLLASLGIYIILQNVLSMVFGDSTKILRSSDISEGFALWNARITSIQIISILVNIVIVSVLIVFLKTTKIGKAMRAVASDPQLADVSGVNSNRVILWAFAIGSALAGLAGILVALDVDMTPTMGMNALMMGVIAVIIGGMNNTIGIVLAALLLAMSQNLGAWYIGSQWQDAIVFVILVMYLLFTPKGIVNYSKY